MWPPGPLLKRATFPRSAALSEPGTVVFSTGPEAYCSQILLQNAGFRETFLARGFGGYVSKPIDERSLITAIAQTLSLPPETVQTRLQAG